MLYFLKIKLNKLINFFTYISLIGRHIEQLHKQFNFRMDLAYRLYTVINISQIEEAYEYNQSKIKQYLLQNKINEIQNFEIDIGIKEFTKIDIQQVDENSYLFVISYKYLNIPKLYKALIYVFFSLLIFFLLYFLI